MRVVGCVVATFSCGHRNNVFGYSQAVRLSVDPCISTGCYSMWANSSSPKLAATGICDKAGWGTLAFCDLESVAERVTVAASWSVSTPAKCQLPLTIAKSVEPMRRGYLNHGLWGRTDWQGYYLLCAVTGVAFSFSSLAWRCTTTGNWTSTRRSAKQNFCTCLEALRI